MKFASAVSERGALRAAVDEVLGSTSPKLTGKPPDLAVVFATSHFEEEMASMTADVSERTNAGALIGCTGEGVIGDDREVERRAGLSLLMACLPEVWTRGFFVDQEMIEAAGEDPEARSFWDHIPDQPSLIILLGDPFSVDILQLLDLLGERFPGCPVVGGMASGAERPGQSVLLLNEGTYRQGAVGLALGGDLRVATVVSQGCRPIGRPLVVTKSERNVVRELGGKPALSVLVEVLESLPPADQSLAQQALFLGRVVNEYQERFGRGDFLVRNLLGADRGSGALVVGDYLRVGTTVQFHVRDAASAHEDLEMMLQPHAGLPPADSGALLFSCNGRGTRMWPEPNHDVSNLHTVVGAVPTAGFFCAGELGSIGGKNFIHGHTASIALFGPPAA